VTHTTSRLSRTQCSIFSKKSADELSALFFPQTHTNKRWHCESVSNDGATVMRQPPSRTATTHWRKIRDKRRQHDFDLGLTNCPNCNVYLDWEYSKRPNSAEVDHKIPFSAGGADTFENTQIICRRCNQSLGGKLGHQRSTSQPTN